MVFVSQTMRHDFVVFVGETFEERVLFYVVSKQKKFSAKLMGELALKAIKL
jgi:hypothetical protein